MLIVLQSFLVAVVIPEKKDIQAFAKQQGISGDYSDLLKDDKVGPLLAVFLGLSQAVISTADTSLNLPLLAREHSCITLGPAELWKLHARHLHLLQHPDLT